MTGPSSSAAGPAVQTAEAVDHSAWSARGCRLSVTVSVRVATTRPTTSRLTHIGAFLTRTDRSACSFLPSLLSRQSPYSLYQHVRVPLPVGKPAPRLVLGPETKS